MGTASALDVRDQTSRSSFRIYILLRKVRKGDSICILGIRHLLPILIRLQFLLSGSSSHMIGSIRPSSCHRWASLGLMSFMIAKAGCHGKTKNCNSVGPRSSYRGGKLIDAGVAYFNATSAGGDVASSSSSSSPSSSSSSLLSHQHHHLLYIITSPFPSKIPL